MNSVNSILSISWTAQSIILPMRNIRKRPNVRQMCNNKMEWQLRNKCLRTSLWKRVCVADVHNWGRKGFFWPLSQCLLQYWVQECWTGDMIILFRVQNSVIMREWKWIHKAEIDGEWRGKICWEKWRLLAKPKQRPLELVQTTESFSPCTEEHQNADARAKIAHFSLLAVA